ncbi:Lrp/AsnC family transcriptional regulator [Nocardia abscessus]|uniref:Lrp/AsnC family transcriptional regulator n=1 Tax=Nocardia abscessus TaxID=120957 RepID=A0ABS0CC57_9NOCA|nr:Lrp/AsnC family transcriptional regulator [Nocardia abscessus]MBF6225988.1 Lrp/AsnC family transcriptional regulator [Nocardia abscessus]
MDSVSLDDIDRSLLHALQLDGRAPFSRLAPVLDVSERTLARRYRRLLDTGGLRVTGVADTGRVGHAEWLVRLRVRPEATVALARALAGRADTAWVTIVAGGAELVCLFRVPGDAPLPELARHPAVATVDAHRVLRHVMQRRWQGRMSALSTEQSAALRAPGADIPAPVAPSELDQRLIPALAADGRATYPRLARAVGWSESAVRRRVEELRDARVLGFDVEIDPALFGFTVQSLLWLTVAPAHLLAVATALADDPEAAFVAATTGPHNLLACVVCRDADALFRYTTERLGALRGIDRMEIGPISGYAKRAAPPRRT